MPRLQLLFEKIAVEEQVLDAWVYPWYLTCFSAAALDRSLVLFEGEFSWVVVFPQGTFSPELHLSTLWEPQSLVRAVEVLRPWIRGDHF